MRAATRQHGSAMALERRDEPDDGERGPERPGHEGRTVTFSQPPSVGRFIVVVGLVVTLLLVVFSKAFGVQPKRLTPGEFLDSVQKGLVKTAQLKADQVKGELHEGGQEAAFYCDLPPRLLVEGKRKLPDGREVTLYEYLDHQIESFKYHKPDGLLGAFLWQLVAWFLLFALLYYFIFRRMAPPGAGGGGPGVLSFGRSRAKLIGDDHVRVTFDDVAGIDEARSEVQEVIEFLRNPERFQALGARIPRGVLLVGPPGTGKTLLAKAIAGEAGVPFFSICGSDFVEMFVGVGASRVRDLFKQAKERSPAIIFLDEIDAVGRRRGAGLGGGHDEREQTLNAILVEMDGFHTDQSVIVLASTNRPDVLDPALSRPGRFDREIVIDLADAKGRLQILEVHARRVKLASDVDLSVIAKSTPGYSGADLEAVINEAALRAVMAGRDRVEQSDLEEGRLKVRFGREKRSMVLTDDDRWTTAVHEAGHAIVGQLLPDADPVHKVTIIPRGRALGLTMALPDRDRYQAPRKRLLAQIKMLYGGRIAEQLLLDDIDGGAQQDIEHATKLARTMVCRWGMSEALGPISYAQNDETVFLGREVTRTQQMSERTAQVVDEEIAKIIRECYAEVEVMLGKHKDALEAVSKALMRYETISGAEVQALIAGTATLETLRPEPEPQPEPQPAPAAPQPASDENSEAADDLGGRTDRDLEADGGLAYRTPASPPPADEA